VVWSLRRKRRFPLRVLDIAHSATCTLYARKLVLVRPDRHIAWRADAEPDDPLELIDHLRGVGIASGPRAIGRQCTP
jgi:hypothetical protein